MKTNTKNVYDELLQELNIKYQNNIESMKQEIKRLEHEIKEEKERIGEDAYRKRILSALTLENK